MGAVPGQWINIESELSPEPIPMVRNKLKLDKFYRELMEKENIPPGEARLIYEALHKEAVSLGVISSKNILEGLEVDLRIARALNGLT